jgi:hypothetical protein
VDSAGDLFGFAQAANGNPTELFELAAGSHSLSVLASVNSSSAYNAVTVARDAAGDIYWLNESVGVAGGGSVFEVAAGTHTAIPIDRFGDSPSLSGPTGLVADAAGNLFGMGADGNTVYEIAHGTSSATTVATTVSGGGVGVGPAGLIQDARGDLFGVAVSDGTLFEVAADTHAVTTPVSSDIDLAGTASVLADAAGNLYCMAGGDDVGGSICEVSGAGFIAGQSAPVIFSQPASQAAIPNGGASFTALDSSTPTPKVQWQASIDGGKTFTDVTGNASATTQTLTLTGLASSQNGTK